MLMMVMMVMLLTMYDNADDDDDVDVVVVYVDLYGDGADDTTATRGSQVGQNEYCSNEYRLIAR